MWAKILQHCTKRSSIQSVTEKKHQVQKEDSTTINWQTSCSWYPEPDEEEVSSQGYATATIFTKDWHKATSDAQSKQSTSHRNWSTGPLGCATSFSFACTPADEQCSDLSAARIHSTNRQHNSSAAASGFQDHSLISPPGYHSWKTGSPRAQNYSAAAASGFQAPATQPFSGNHDLNTDYSKSEYAQSTNGSRSPWKVFQFSSPFFSPMCRNESSYYGNPHNGDQQNFTNTNYTVL